ncbi:unnamed protein product, partial [Rotaria sordida]
MAAGGEGITKSSLRFTDIVGEPSEPIALIHGYEKMPLISLEEAVKPLVSILPDVQYHASIAKKNCKNPDNGLTQDESASIMLYTMEWIPHNQSLYVVLNTTLRLEGRERKLKPWHLYLRLFLNALFRLPTLRITAYRRVRLDLSKHYIKGETIIWWDFSDCTTSVSALESEHFLETTDVRTMFIIQCQTAKDIREHSFVKSEDTVLLMAGTQFKVISCLKQGDLHVIQLEETLPSVSLLQPVPKIVPSHIKPIAT